MNTYNIRTALIGFKLINPEISQESRAKLADLFAEMIIDKAGLE